MLNKLPSRKDIYLFRSKITRWFNKNKRNYPWRKTRDPFKVLIAEMMLSRTKANQVKPVYEHFFKEFPDIESLEEAENKKLEKVLHPLGLNWRIPSFGLVAREIREKYQCRVPETREELTLLPGVGDYVAGAVLSLAYDKKEWIVDVNVVRIFKRYFGLKTSVEGRRDKNIIQLAKMYVSCKNPRKANLAILDFTALACTSINPNCQKCVMRKTCFRIL